MPERESDHLTPATRLLEKKREMAEVESALVSQKEVQIPEYIVMCGCTSTAGVSDEDGNTSAKER